MDFSIQLYSGRNEPSMEAFIGKVASYGYKQVEGFGGLYADAEGLSATLKKNGLVMPTGHFGLGQLQDTSAAMKTAETLGIKTLICPAIPKEERSGDDGKWAALGDTLAKLGETLRRSGFGFGWHNHDFEFTPTSSGRLPMDIILEHSPNNDWEVDVAWVVKGEQDPLVWLKKYGPRVTAVHVKDIAPAGQAVDEDGWADVGYGTLDWPALAAAVKAYTAARYWVMEHDKPSDAARFAQRSIESARKW